MLRLKVMVPAVAMAAAGMVFSACQQVSPPPAGRATHSSSAASGIMATAVFDGDTFRVQIDGRSERVRVLGINAPEVAHPGSSEQCGGEASRSALDRMIYRKVVVLQRDSRSDDRDRYGRLLRYVEVADGPADVGLMMLQQGRASEYHPRSGSAESRESSYRAAQVRAQQERRGQWSGCTTVEETKQ